MKLIPTSLAEVVIVETPVFGDDRGAFWETHHTRKFLELGLDIEFVQDAVSRSRKNTVRGLHFQEPNAQGKLVGVVGGAILDIAVDIRPQSPTFRKWVSTELSDMAGRFLWIPPGFAHGFLALSDVATVSYKLTAFWAPDSEHGILWNDPEIGITWPIENPIMSPRDARLPLLRDSQVLPPYVVVTK